jgi:euchromatic histone-lysine N-methyltransferase
MSGISEDNLDKADEIIYTSQGGNDLLCNHHQIVSQQLTLGNLALKNTRDNGNTVRVIRGHLSKNSYTRKVYNYDGLYKVVDDWVQNGMQGHVVLKFKLKRLEGQPSLTSHLLFLVSLVLKPARSSTSSWLMWTTVKFSQTKWLDGAIVREHALHNKSAYA